MSRIQRIIFTEASLEHALSAVRGLHDMSTELIASDVFRQMSELATYRLTPVTIWCGTGGLYKSRLDAIANGEQQSAPAILIGTPDELIEDAHLERDPAIAECKRLQALPDERSAQLAVLKRRHDGLHRDMLTIATREVPKGCTVADYATGAIANALSDRTEPSETVSLDEQGEPS